MSHSHLPNGNVCLSSQAIFIVGKHVQQSPGVGLWTLRTTEKPKSRHKHDSAVQSVGQRPRAGGVGRGLAMGRGREQGREREE